MSIISATVTQAQNIKTHTTSATFCDLNLHTSLVSHHTSSSVATNPLDLGSMFAVENICETFRPHSSTVDSHCRTWCLVNDERAQRVDTPSLQHLNRSFAPHNQTVNTSTHQRTQLRERV